jgi:uncharacterized protein
MYKAMTTDELYLLIAGELGLKVIQVKNTVELLDEDNTVPFIARYRKERTGSLDENQIRDIEDRVKYLRVLEERKKTVLKTIADQGKLTPELEKKILATTRMQELEDLYLPYKPKKRTRATMAREKGLEKLAQIILAQGITSGEPDQVAAEFIDSEKGVSGSGEAIRGACDIIAEIFSENAEIRGKIREYTRHSGMIQSEKKNAEADKVYEHYFNYKEMIKKIPPHRILAMNRGENEEALRISIEVEESEIYSMMEAFFIVNRKSIFYELLKDTVKDAYNRLLAPAISREIRSFLTELAGRHAIEVFSVNLKNLLMQPPVADVVIMGIDPGFRTGCKVAVIDKTGKYLDGTTIYPHPPQSEYFQAKSTLRDMITSRQIDIIAIGNGTASRETELMVSELIGELKEERQVAYTIVNEAGASVYSASKIAQEEFPDLDASMRGNISIARRLLDPLAELVKIDPRSIGVGLYQHDLNQGELTRALENVVESCVNTVGIDLNTASPSLLKYVSGITVRMAKNIVDHRNRIGKFTRRTQLLDVEGIGESAFQQSAGFLRIRGGDNPLEITSIHPESYTATEKLLQKFSVKDIHQGGKQLKQKIKEMKTDLNLLAVELECGVPTLEDILNDLERPGRDPREELPRPVFRIDVLKIEDLRPGMVLKGTVRNVVDFGIFVDIGVKQDGLVHISELADRFVKSAHEIVGVGDVIDVRILRIDLERQRIALSMKTEKSPKGEND